ncbi:MAG: hypothetical protein H6617_05855 [Bdellovibrionaceae bacterium]|nr:hypothetical protein [Bdellovibrionales bacterium]MCB9254190.1 hypothetical protein [Pseudobdellovibrionaceae bacterium]
MKEQKKKPGKLTSDQIQVYVVAVCWIGIFVALMVYGATHSSKPPKELPKTFHREWSGKFY